MTSPRQNRPQSKQVTNDGSQKRILIYVVLLVLMILYLILKPSAPTAPPPGDPAAPPAAASTTSSATPAPTAPAATPALPVAAPTAPVAATADDGKTSIAKSAEECAKQVPGVIGYPAANPSNKEKFCGCVSDAQLKIIPVEGPDARDSGIRQCFADLLHEAPPYSATRNMPTAEKVTDADLANIPADKLELLKKYCNALAYKKAQEYRVDPKVFISLNASYINSCILMQSKPGQAPVE